MDRNKKIPLHQLLLRDPDGLRAAYDQAASELIEAVRPEGYFEGWTAEELTWPSRGADQIGLEGLLKRARIVDAIYNGVPALRDRRLREAHDHFIELTPAYHEGNRIYLRLRDEFVGSGAGTGSDFLKLYQSLYVEALAKGDDFSPDLAETALAQARISRVPLSHARAVAEALPTVETDDDPRWRFEYACDVNGETWNGTLRELLENVAQRTLHLISAGELLATRYNTYNNLGWFGSSVWKVVADADVRLHQMEVSDAEGLAALKADVNLCRSMLVEFLAAHREDPARLRPANYWYGQPYSYLTRDMIDLSVRIVDAVNSAARNGDGSAEVALPPLLAGTHTGRFLEYAHVGVTEELTSFQRKIRMLRWARRCWRVGRRRKRIAEEDLTPSMRHERAWEVWLDWSRDTMNAFGIRLEVTIAPMFRTLVREMDLSAGGQRILFLPSHQSMLEHFVVFSVFNDPVFLDAMGWDRSRPVVQLARTGLAKSTSVKIGSREISIFGMSPDKFDRMFETVDGFITRDSVDISSHTIPRILQEMERRPGVIYPMGTTASFDVQLFPLQHALFAKLPQDVVMIPIVFRGSHALWPKCPARNLNINPGVIEAVILPPMPGETTLLPRRRSLRIQLEAANLLQAVHISNLLNPEPSR